MHSQRNEQRRRKALSKHSTRVVDLFHRWDTNNDGVVGEKEFERAMVGPEGTEVELLVRFKDEQGPWEGVVNLQRSALR